jgi:hypothetical protein
MATLLGSLSQPLLNYFKSLTNLVSQLSEFEFEHRLLGIDHQIDRDTSSRPAQTNRLSQSSFHAIALDRSAKHSPDRESNAESPAVPAQQIKNRHVGRKVATALLVHPLEIAVPEQAHAAGKPGAFAGDGQVNTTVRIETAHTTHDPDSVCGITTNSGKGNRLLTEAGLY